jgi:hypothetical protein
MPRYNFMIHVRACASAETIVCVKTLMAENDTHVRFEVSTAVTMKNGVFWDVTPCGSCKTRRFGGTWRLLHQGDKNR